MPSNKPMPVVALEGCTFHTCFLIVEEYRAKRKIKENKSEKSAL
jgi:hypothetical protein